MWVWVVGARHFCSAGEVPLQAPQSHGGWHGMGWDRLGCVCERQRETRCRREGVRLTDQTPAMWKEVPHNRVSNRVVCRKGQHRTHTSHTLGHPHMGGTHPRHHQIPAPKTRSTEACQTQQPLTTKWGSHMQRGHAELSHLQQHMTHVRTVRAITASQVRHDPLTFHLPHNKSQPEPEQA